MKYFTKQVLLWLAGTVVVKVGSKRYSTIPAFVVGGTIMSEFEPMR